jgi:AcrR family transcriptional regulator
VAGLRERNKQLRVEQVLRAASGLFASRGYEATRIEEIAKAAEVAPATVYNYFATKPDILAALAVRHVRASLPERRALVRNPPADPVEAVQAFERLLADQSTRILSRDCWRVILSAPHTQPGGAAHRTGQRFNWLIRRHYTHMLGTFQHRGLIRNDVNIEVLADLITAIGTQHFSRFVSNNAMTLDELKAAVERHIDLIFIGLVSEPGTIS